MSQLSRGDPLPRFVSQFVILIGMSDAIDRGKEYEAAGQVEVVSVCYL